MREQSIIGQSIDQGYSKEHRIDWLAGLKLGSTIFHVVLKANANAYKNGISHRGVATLAMQWTLRYGH